MIGRLVLPPLLLALAACDPAGPAPAFRFVEATIEDVQQAVRSGRMSCAEIVDGYLARIAAYDQPSGLGAIIFTNPAVRQAAADIDRRQADGEVLGSLFCVPVLLKDNLDTADMPTSGGSIALKDSIPPDDASMEPGSSGRRLHPLS